MKLSATHPVAAPKDAVFERLRDVDTLLADLGPGGADLKRQDPDEPPQVGSVWLGTLVLNGAARPMVVRLVEITPQESLRIAAESAGMIIDALVSVAPGSAGDTDLTLAAELRAKTLAGRVAVQSLRLVQGKITGKLQDRVGRLARHLEQASRA